MTSNLNNKSIDNNHHNTVTTIGDVYNVFAATLGRVFTGGGDMGKALSMAEGAAKKAVNALLAYQVADASNGFHAMTVFRMKWANVTGKKPMEFRPAGRGEGMKVETQEECIERLFCALINSPHAARWPEMFGDTVCAGLGDFKFLAEMRRYGMERCPKAMAPASQEVKAA